MFHIARSGISDLFGKGEANYTFTLLMGLIGNGVDNAAHIGGLCAGIAWGLVFSPLVKLRAERAEREADPGNQG